MKLVICIAIASILICIKKNALAQQAKPYIAVVNTGTESFKGVLYQVCKDSIGIKKEDGIFFFRGEDIKTITLKEIRKGSKFKSYLGYNSNYNEKRYEKVSNKMVPVRKWGERNPTIEEELSGRILTGIYSSAINSIGNLLSGNLNTIEVNYNKAVYAQEAMALVSHCISSQNPSEDQIKIASTN
jgi:hypothetical protein